ncbi:hypothetical protein ACC764_38370, partial [Rhizobium ruizarguesonis]
AATQSLATGRRHANMSRRYPILRSMIRLLSLLLLLCLPLASTEPVAAQSTASAVAGLGPRSLSTRPSRAKITVLRDPIAGSLAA